MASLIYLLPPLPMTATMHIFLNIKVPKNHGEEDYFETICGSVAPLAGWRDEMVFETELPQDW